MKTDKEKVATPQDSTQSYFGKCLDCGFKYDTRKESSIPNVLDVAIECSTPKTGIK